MLTMFLHMFLPHCRSAAPWPSPLHEPISLLLLIKWRFTTAMWKISPSRCGVGVRCGHVCTRTYTHTHICTYMDWVEVCTCLSVCLSVCLSACLSEGKGEGKERFKAWQRWRQTKLEEECRWTASGKSRLNEGFGMQCGRTHACSLHIYVRVPLCNKLCKVT